MWFLTSLVFLVSIFIFFIFGVPFFGCMAMAWLVIFFASKVRDSVYSRTTDHGPRDVKNLRILSKTFSKD